ncbi:MAG: MBL fold metallo-hydrolase [Candidatus Pelagibacter sp. TMED118]|nr:MAG: MBL fold metallo-hydrolase [Candidatus Pelagibacter sp. TMED118]|tara:strand:+ start:507 stop:1283 length:777 start_codon:yes stop_codon:yes gene_type:complete
MTKKLTILGSGSSLGVPRIDGNFGKCNPKNKKNHRTRCCAHLKFNEINILIDTSPDLRFQLLSNKIKDVNTVLYTHAHADQTHGINDLRAFYIKYRKRLNVYADTFTRKLLMSSFGYCFKNKPGYPAILKLNNLKKKHIFISKKSKLLIEPIMTQHGLIQAASYLINKKIFYGSDVSKIYDKDLKKLKKLDFFIIDCLRYEYHPSHYNLDDVLSIIKIIKPKNTILTNLHSSVDYSKLKKILPKNIIPAFDGMKILFN